MTILIRALPLFSCILTSCEAISPSTTATARHHSLEKHQGSRSELCLLDDIFRQFDICAPLYTPSLGTLPSYGELDLLQGTCHGGYCVYTERQFWSGRGISLVTRPEAMRNAALNAIVQNSRQRTTVNVEKEAFEEVQMPGKGVGLVAKRFLPKGDLLISEPPSLMVHLDMRAAVPEKHRLQMQQEGVDRLPLLTKSETMGLMGHWGGDPVEDILDTNSFTITVHAANDHHALFIQTSRLNHDCRPNCMYTFDPKTFTQNVYTIRDISPGEELTISYIDPTVTHKERQEAISFWGFNCSCHTCTMSPEDIRQSDERIQLINGCKELLNDWSIPQNNATPEMARTLVDLYKKEKLWCHIADGYRLAAHAYNAVRDRGNALRMANLAFGYGLQAWRYMGRKMIDMLELMTSPEEHWTWGQRDVIYGA